jgi:hypothetical protein
MAADLAAGGERAAIAQARQDVGWSLFITGGMLAYGGMITGGGPTDRRLRKDWLDAGNQPYSVRLSDGTQVSYRRLEPFATPLALMADFVTILGEIGEQDAEDMAVAIMAAMSNVVNSKTFLQGITEFADALASGDPFTTRRFMGNLAGSFLPNFMRQTNPDEMFREVGSLLEDLKARTYGMSETLEPRRNFFGDPVMKPPGYFNRSLNPFTVMGNPDPILAELTELGDAVPIPPRRIGAVDLTDRTKYDNGTGQSPRDRAQELLANPKHGPSLQQAIKDRMSQPDWPLLSSGTAEYPGGLKLQQIEAIWRAHWKAAYVTMLSEYPKLQEALRADKVSKAASLIGETEALFNR